MIGSIVDGEYEIQEFIGEGSFGVVYRCRDLKLGRDVALKMINRSKAPEREVKRLYSEARNLASVSHPNVVPIYRLGEHDGTPYFAMEYLHGRSLRDVSKRTRLPMRKCLDIMRQVASGMRAIHAAGIVHRDLSPNNIIVNEEGKATILDLGLSKELQDLNEGSTQKYLAGTLAYVSPEQIQGLGATFQSEIFSLGVILYELLTGTNPFRAEHTMSLLYNIAHRPPTSLREQLPDCPTQLVEFVSKCLAKSAADRPRDMTEVETKLEVLLASALVDASSTTPMLPVLRALKSSSKNPYLNQVMIKRHEDFFGRTQEVKRIFARLNASPPGSISIVGDRKIGKSSLLNYVYSRQTRLECLEHPDKMIMVFLDLQSEKNMAMESFVRSLLGIASLELRGRLDVSDCAHNLDGVKDMVQRLDAAGFRVAILLDEFDAVTTNANFGLEFFSFLRFLANHYNVAYLTSSARDLQTLCHTQEISDSPFFNIFSTLRLSVFQQEEAMELIRVPSQRSGKPLEPHAEQILNMAGLFPFFIQIACCSTFEILEENPEAAAPDFAEVRRRFYEEAKFHYRYLWDGFDIHERSAILRVANGKSIPDALRHVLDELGSKHYVEPENGRLKLFAATFEQFVRGEARKSSKQSLLGRMFGR